MRNGYHATSEDDHPDVEDEFLCEYVDGTMDPIVQEVFEEYLRANPGMREHVECLRHTRLLLCQYGCRCRAPRDLHDRLRRQITCDLLSAGVPFHLVATDRLRGTATVSCAVAFLVLVGLLVGASGMDTRDGYSRVVSAAVVSTQHSSPPTDRSAVPSHFATQPLPFSPRSRLVAPIPASRSLVASGLELELGSRARVAYASAANNVFP